MIILNLTDGLGNQMFQYAFARYLQSVYDGKVYLIMTMLGRRHRRDYELHYFKLNKNVIIPNQLLQLLLYCFLRIYRIYLNRFKGYSLIDRKGYELFASHGYYTTNNVYCCFPFLWTKKRIKFVWGFFQNEKWFVDIKSCLLQEYKWKNLNFRQDIIKLAEFISSKQSVCVHIRREDYTKVARFMVCNEDYYRRGIDYIRSLFPDSELFIFSNSHDDILWIKNHYHFGGDITYVDMNNKGIEDFFLMRLCKHFVISNSTYSWWAAYLSESQDKVVVAPHPWVKSECEQCGIYCDGWKVIDII